MNLKSKKTLVTGAAGFIGSHLVEALVKEGACVVAFVHYNSRADYGNLRYLPKDTMKNVELVMGDICDSSAVDSAIQGCDAVFHLAALIGIPYSYVAPRSYVATNISGTMNVLEAVRRNGIARMVHTSTSECYGTAEYVPIDEKHPLKGQSPYSASKIGADKMVESYVKSFELPAVTVRPFNTYGPRQSARAVIPTIISQLIAGNKKVVLGSLTPERDLTFVKDTARGFILAAKTDKAIGQTINLGNGSCISIGDLADKIVQQLSPDAEIVSAKERVRPENSEVMKLMCDNSKAKSVLGWKPEISLDEGLKRTAEFIRINQDLFRPETYTI